jgi:hypothetical protein
MSAKCHKQTSSARVAPKFFLTSRAVSPDSLNGVGHSIARIASLAWLRINISSPLLKISFSTEAANSGSRSY